MYKNYNIYSECLQKHNGKNITITRAKFMETEVKNCMNVLKVLLIWKLFCSVKNSDIGMVRFGLWFRLLNGTFNNISAIWCR